MFSDLQGVPNKFPLQWSLMSGQSNLYLRESTVMFEWEGHIYRLIRPVSYQVTYKDGWIYRCPRYGIYAFSRIKSEALADFNEEYAFLYDGLVSEPDENLTQDAIILKRKIIEDSYPQN